MDERVAQALSAEMQVISSKMFGQKHRLALCLYIRRHPTGTFTLTEAAEVLGVAVSTIQRPVDSLLACGVLVRPDDGVPSDRSRPLVRAESLLWPLVDEMIDRNGLQLPLDI